MDRFEGLSVQPIDDRKSLHWEMVSCSEVACGETPLAARPPASGRWHRGMNLQEFSAEPTLQRVHPNTGTTGGVGPGTSHPPCMYVWTWAFRSGCSQASR